MAKKKGGKKETSEFGKRFGGAVGAGFPPDEAAAIAMHGSKKKPGVKESAEGESVAGNLKKLGEMYPNMRRK